ncbi:Pkinase-domain-containing protein [Cystobasidium minutum MCA 4210]|uniref:Pkinase-domain-containing protein n=1 Tax=Cystobasidium minutum MCA 4210 TaxID=1397322 RepID=UPI0034CDC12A|eukprot:jgi/Rhomi1/180035/fgenesh1_pg.4_\
MGGSMSLSSMHMLDLPCSFAISPTRASHSSSSSSPTTGNSIDQEQGRVTTTSSTDIPASSTRKPPFTPFNAQDTFSHQPRHSSSVTMKNSVNTGNQEQRQDTRKEEEEYVDDLTMGDIAMLSTAAPRVHPGTTSTSTRRSPRSSPDNRASSSSSSTSTYFRGTAPPAFQSLRRDIDMPRVTMQSSPYSCDTAAPSSSSSSSTATRTHSGVDASGAAVDALSTTHLPSLPSSPPSFYSSHSSSTVMNTTSPMHSLLTSSRNTLPPLPTLDTNPATVLPPLPRIPASTTSAASSHTHITTTMMAQSPSNTTSAVSIPNASPPSQMPSAASAISSTIAAPSKPTQQSSSAYPDSRLKRYMETQADYRPGGYARINEGDRLNRGRYEIVKKLGVGHFSVVWLAWDRQEGGYVAIKVVRSSRRYGRAAMSEYKLLSVIQGPQDERKNYIVTFLNSFEEPAWEGPDDHVCLVFEIMGMSLTDVLRKNDFNGLPIKTTKLIAKQALTALSYLHSTGIAHTDIKPDNILLYHSPRTMSKMLRTQLRADDLERERQEAEEALNPKPEPVNWLEYKPKIPGLNPQQIREIQLARIRAESRKWNITPSMPLDSPIPFANGRKIVKEFILANKHLYKLYPSQSRSDSMSIEAASTASGSQSAKNSFEIDRTSATHPNSAEGSLKVDNAAEKNAEAASAQTTPIKDGNTTANFSYPSSVSPSKGKGTDTTNTTESSMTAPSSRQSSKSPYSSLGRIRPVIVNAAKDTAPSSPYTAMTRTFDRLSIGDFLKRQQQANEMDIQFGTRTSLFGPSRHPRTSSNGSSNGQQSGGETEFEKLLRQPMEYDVPGSLSGLAINTSGPSPIFMKKSPSDSDGSEVFSPASTTMTRFFNNTSGASSTDSPASLASTPVGSSPELLMARKLPSPIFPHPGAIYSSAISIPRQQALTRNGSNASIFGGSSFASFSPGEYSVLQDQDFKSRGSIGSAIHARLARARSDVGFEDGQGFMSLPSSPPSHPTSYISVASQSPEVSMRKGSGAGMGLSGLSRSGSDASVNIGATFDFAIQEEDETETASHEFGASQGEEANVTLTTSKQPRGLPSVSSNIHGLGLSMTDASPPLNHHLFQWVQRPNLPREPKVEPLESPARVKTDPLLDVHVKISDLGNAIFYNQLKARGGLPENVCTRNYRPPENIIGADYDLGVDVWALGCVIYEMLTGEMMFNPQAEKYRYTKEDDLLGQQIEIPDWEHVTTIVGPFDPEFALSGKKSLAFFNSQGQLIRVRLNPWPLFDVMVKKFYMPRAKARKFCDFLLRMLEPDPTKRATVDELLQDPWLNEIEEDDDLVLLRQRKKDSTAPAETA